MRSHLCGGFPGGWLQIQRRRLYAAHGQESWTRQGIKALYCSSVNVWPAHRSTSISQELEGNIGSQVRPQTCWIEICIWTRCPGNSFSHWSWRTLSKTLVLTLTGHWNPLGALEKSDARVPSSGVIIWTWASELPYFPVGPALLRTQL